MLSIFLSLLHKTLILVKIISNLLELLLRYLLYLEKVLYITPLDVIDENIFSIFKVDGHIASQFKTTPPSTLHDRSLWRNTSVSHP